ncbi:MAG: glycosyltransferase family 2 protein [bacterium]|nr:glycosyltransferase family 2 protein [bacterium]
MKRKNLKCSIIVPVYNEKDTILSIIEKLKNGSINKELIIVDDFSTDGTREILEKIKNQKIKVIYHNRNRGKGEAIRSGLQYVTGNVVIIQDADMEYKPEEYPRLLKPIEEGKACVVYGSRFRGKGEFVFSSLVANKILTFLTNLFYGSRLTDMETCYKCIETQVINGLNLHSKRFDFEPEVTAKLLRKGIKILEVPISYKGRSTKGGKKIGFWDGLQAIWTLVKWRVK